MEIRRYHSNMMIYLNKRKYVEMVLHRFRIQESNPIKVLIPLGVNLSIESCPKT